MLRIAGKLGCTFSPPPDALGLRFIRHYLVEPLPKAPVRVDHIGGRNDWLMLGNDTHGDCAVAGAEHLKMVDARIAQEQFVPPSDEATIKAYLTFTGGQDVGCVPSALWSYWHRKGLLGDRLAGFAPARPRDTAELRSVVSLFGAAGIGVRLPAVAQEQFEAHQPWDLTGTAADDQIEGGHFVVVAKYGPAYGWCLTWGGVQPFTWRWYARYVEEVWALLTAQFVAAKPGVVNIAALTADLGRMAV
jgi:hypothetical protein